MRLPDAAVESLKEHLTHPFTPKVHIEDTTVYNNGLTDGARMLAEWVLSQLKPDVVVPEEYEKVELCQGCGKLYCDSCPCGTYTVIRKKKVKETK